ncbi:MAG: TonB-dependent receptor [Desulfobacteraceae bacterium]|nr:TonB-dependent receptor [Desulfobacteraceae bacterium]
MKCKFRCSMLTLLLTLFLLLGAAALSKAEEKAGTEQTPKTGSKKETAVTIEDVVVRGQAADPDLEATSATVLDNEKIINRVYITPLDIVSLSPGVSITQYQQGGTASNFVMRGFTGNSHGPNAAIFLDGIPLNEGDGYADTNLINPEEIERVELIKGPSSALYGNYASAGTLAFYTLKQVDHNHLKLQYGFYDTHETNFVGGLSDEKWDQVYAIQNYHTDGYQKNSDWDKLNGAARLTRHFTDRLDVRLSLRGFNSDWDAPGYISQAQFDQDPTQAVSETNGGGKDRTEGRVDADYKLSAQSKLLFNVWSYNQEFWRWYASDPTGLAPTANVGNLRDFKRDVWGSGASYNFLGSLAGRELNLVAGADYMLEDDGRQRWYLLAGTGREKGPKYWDYVIKMQTLSFYGQGGYQVFDPLRIIVGARYDTFVGHLVDHLDDDAKFYMKDQNVFSPKAGLIMTVLDKRLDIFANYGKGFALLPGFSEQAAFKEQNWQPQERDQYEVGLRGRPNKNLSAELVAYKLLTTKDFIYNSVTDDYENVGETTRDGIELSLDYTLLTFGYLHADYGYVNPKYDKYVVNGVDLAGKTIMGAPQNICNAEIGYMPQRGYGGRLRYHYEDGYYLDDPNLYKSDAWDRFDAQLSYRFGQTANYLLALDAVNLLNKKYADYTSGTTSRTYSPALPLSLYATFTVDF